MPGQDSIPQIYVQGVTKGLCEFIRYKTSIIIVVYQLSHIAGKKTHKCTCTNFAASAFVFNGLLLVAKSSLSPELVCFKKFLYTESPAPYFVRIVQSAPMTKYDEKDLRHPCSRARTKSGGFHRHF